MVVNDLELVSNFCNNSNDPLLYTLPIKFCDHNIFREKVLRDPVFIAMVSIGIFIALYGLVLVTWHTVLLGMVGKFIKLSESERIEYMLKVAGSVGRRRELEWKLRREVEQHTGVPAQLSAGKETLSDSSSFGTIRGA